MHTHVHVEAQADIRCPPQSLFTVCVCVHACVRASACYHKGMWVVVYTQRKEEGANSSRARVTSSCT